MNKLSVCVFTILLTSWISPIQGEVDICFNFDSFLKPKVNISDSNYLFEEVKNHFENVLATTLIHETSQYNHTHFNFSHPAITLAGDFDNGTLSMDPTILKIFYITPSGFELFNITYPSIYLNGTYQMDGYVGANDLFSIYGNGTFWLNLKNFSVAAYTKLTINLTSLCIPLTLNVSVQGYDGNFFNFMNGDDQLDPLLNETIKAIVPEAIEIIWREALDGADETIQKIIDKILHGGSSKSISRLLYALSMHKEDIFSGKVPIPQL